jgi:hypothetical protein
LMQLGPDGASDDGPVRKALAAADEPKRRLLHALGLIEPV